MKITRQKRPDKIFINFGLHNIWLVNENKDICIDYGGKIPKVFPKSEIPNLIKALTLIIKEEK